MPPLHVIEISCSFIKINLSSLIDLQADLLTFQLLTNSQGYQQVRRNVDTTQTRMAGRSLYP